MATHSLSRLHIVSRIAAGVLGGYAFTWGFIALGIGLLFAARMEFHDAEALGYIVGFIVFLVAFLWAFSAASPLAGAGRGTARDRSILKMAEVLDLALRAQGEGIMSSSASQRLSSEPPAMAVR